MQFIYGTGVDTFLRRSDELAASYGVGFMLDEGSRENLKRFEPVH
jgi:3-hydroxyacyl-CoA dehydrogenase/enoyl-CoA hydratase/3-hydroxybutyryl-CoA epimerase